MRKLLFLLTFFCLTVSAQDTPNARQAKRIFTTAWNHIYGPEGAQFQYKINILGLYKEEGTSWNKGDKAKSVYKDTKMWNDSKTKYILREKKGVIEIHDPKVNKKDEKLQMFKFDSNSYNYSIAKEGDDFMVTLEAKPNAKVKMKKIEALLAPTTYYPKRLRIKVNIFWATITFANFKTGNIDDSIFNFPREKYKDYKIIDER